MERRISRVLTNQGADNIHIGLVFPDGKKFIHTKIFHSSFNGLAYGPEPHLLTNFRR